MVTLSKYPISLTSFITNVNLVVTHRLTHQNGNAPGAEKRVKVDKNNDGDVARPYRLLSIIAIFVNNDNSQKENKLCVSCCPMRQQSQLAITNAEQQP
jgi:hypothetical protein